MNMNDVERNVQKHLLSFCKSLPAHIQYWRLMLQESVKPIQVLLNLCEQKCSIKRTRIQMWDDFNDARDTLFYEIGKRVEDEIASLTVILDKLNTSNIELKNKIVLFERSTLSLNWDSDTEIIRGNGSCPSLARLLQNSLWFLNFFITSNRRIRESLKGFNIDNEKSVKKLQASFDLNLDDKVVTNLIALTQYVDNESAII